MTSSRRSAFAKFILLCWLALAGCKTPPHTNESGRPAAASMPPPLSSPTQQPTPAEIPAPGQTEKLSSVVTKIFAAANVTGSMTERCRCTRDHVLEMYSMAEGSTAEPMDKALQEIRHQYPEFHVTRDSKGRVRISDATARAGLLRVRVRQFNVVEDHPPQAALAALWRVPEVESFMRSHAMRPARAAQNVAAKKTVPVVIQMKNATVADILDRIVETHHAEAGSFSMWVYRECHYGAETIVDFKLL